MKSSKKKAKDSPENSYDVLRKFAHDFEKMKDKLTLEDLQIAMESLKTYTDHVKEQEKLKAELEEIHKQEAYIDEITCMDLPADWTNAFAEDDRASGIKVGSISDGLIMSLTTLGMVDIEYISKITGETLKDVINSLKGSIYQNPEKWNECFYKGWETADEYLSGNILRKLSAAKAASEKYMGYFDENVNALTKVLPPTVTSDKIYITLGSPWVPAEIIDDFIRETFGRSRANSDLNATIHDPITGKWIIPNKSRYGNNLTCTTLYGTSRINALEIIEKTLNMRNIVVYDIKGPDNKRVFNEPDTLLALEKQQSLLKLFQRWVWRNKNRKKRLVQIYEEKFGCVCRRKFSGEFLNFPGMSEEIQLYPYQKDAVARILFCPNTLLAHDVGSGKTLVMIAAGMELKRMRLSEKNMYVVPNNILSQWERMFKNLYPAADILCISPQKFKPDKREDILKKIRDEKFDAVIIAASCFDLIPVSKKYYSNMLKEKLDTVNKSIYTGNYYYTKMLEKHKTKLSQALTELENTLEESLGSIFFEDLGVTTLFVDEAQSYKNLPLETPMKLPGISRTGSEKARLMLAKVRCVQNHEKGKGVVFATGTPLSNSLTDAFVMQKYLQNGELRLLNLNNFQSWLSMFAEKTTEFEIDVDTSQFRMYTRFSKFHNLPELTALLAQIADFHKADSENKIPDFDGYTDCLVPQTDEFRRYLSDISDRADMVRSGAVSRDVDNMLKITTDGRKAALDIRLVDNTAGFTYDSKVWCCAENIRDIYFETYDFLGTQLVFCDISTPCSVFNIYDELARCLECMDIPRKEIAFIHDAESNKQKDTLIRKVNSGEIRILLGSTFKLGTGINVQERLVALHHLDVPWRPADMVQREGRILRQGNTNSKVNIFRYITEGSFDAYSWQLIERKQLFISQILAGFMSERSSGDIDESVLNYAEVKALAIGNPLIKKRVQTANELSRLITLQRKLIAEKEKLKKEQQSIPKKIRNMQRNIQLCREDSKFCNENPFSYTDEQRRDIRTQIAEAMKTAEISAEEKEILKYCGFKVIIPSNFSNKAPFLKLVRSGTYIVSLGNSETGILIRIDNKISSIPKHIDTLLENFHELNKRYMEINRELTDNKSYLPEIESVQKQLDDIDCKLGVK